jgi:hypothetical protein
MTYNSLSNKTKKEILFMNYISKDLSGGFTSPIVLGDSNLLLNIVNKHYSKIPYGKKIALKDFIETYCNDTEKTTLSNLVEVHVDINVRNYKKPVKKLCFLAPNKSVAINTANTTLENIGNNEMLKHIDHEDFYAIIGMKNIINGDTEQKILTPALV